MRREVDFIPTLPGKLFVPLEAKSPASLGRRGSTPPNGESLHSGVLIVNADDWGRNRETSEQTLECVLRGAVSSVSAMVFMEDSERAASTAQEHGVDAGLHLNFTTPFSAPDCPARLAERQRELAACLLRNRFARVVFHPWLGRSFEYVAAAQLEEFCRLYGAEPTRLDGHHHMHLCSNVLFKGLLPPGTLVRRHFSYESGEKIVRNCLFRKFTDVLLARRHRLVDFFFSLPPLEPPSRLQQIFALARQFAVEVETHPLNPEEYRFLAGGEVFRWAGDCPISPHFVLRSNGTA